MKNMRGSLGKDARTLRPVDVGGRSRRLEGNAAEVDELEVTETRKATGDYSEFCREYLKFVPFSYQDELIELYKQFQFVAARWCRQSGKSWIASNRIPQHSTLARNNGIP